MRWSPILLCLGLQSCAATSFVAELWRGPDPRTPRDRFETIAFELADVRGTFDASPLVTHLQLRLVSPTKNPDIGYAARWTEETPGCISIAPSPFEPNWLFAADPAFVPEAWNAKIFGGQHSNATGFQARVEFEGHVEPSVLGTVVDTVRPDVTFRANTLAERWESDALESLEQHDWGSLLADQSATAEPLAWISRDGTHAAAPPAIEPGALELLVALKRDDGSEQLATIPAAVLAGSYGQELTRRGDSVHWRYSAVWRARHTRPTRAPRFPVSRGPTLVAYEWSYPIPEPETPIYVTLAKIGATPFAFAADVGNFLVETNPPLRRLKRFLLDFKFEDLKPIRRRDD